MTSILIDGKQLPLMRPLVVQRDTVLAPVSGVIDRLADRVQIAHDGSVLIARGSHTFVLYPGRRSAWVNGALRTLPAAPRWLNGTEYVPLLSVLQGLGLSVNANAHSSVITIRTPPAALLTPMTPMPSWYPQVQPHAVFSPVVTPMPRWTTPPGPRRTPVQVAPYYRACFMPVTCP